MPRPRPHGRRRSPSHGSIARSLEEYGRGVAGGLIFSLPLLFTMEVWWAGFTASPGRLLAGLGATLVLLLGFNEHAGLRSDHGPIEVLIDSIEELGIGLLLACGVLALLGRIDLSMPAGEILGKVLVEGLLVAIGVSVGTAQLGGGDPREQGTSERGGNRGIAAVLVLSVCGAVILAANVAPTEEILVLATEMSPLRLLLTMAASALLAALVLFFTEFRGSSHLRTQRSVRSVVDGCVITYAVALAASACILWFFGRFDGASARVMLAQTVVLGFAATLGASAGRLLLREDA